MGLKLITAPTVEPVTLAEVKEQLSIPDTIQDNVINRHIPSARRYAENYTQRSLLTQTWELALDAFSDEIELYRQPVQSITSVKYIDTDGVEQTLSSPNYGLDDYSPRHWLIPAIDTEWPDTHEGSNMVKIRYVTGYGDAASDIPDDIRQAIFLTIGHWINFQPQAELGVSVTMVPRAVDHLLFPYRRWVI